MRKRMNTALLYVKASKKDYYYVSGAALSDDPEVQPLMGMAYKTFCKHKYGLDEPYENEYVIVKRGVLFGPDKEEGHAEVCPSFLHPHLSVLNIVLYCIQNHLCIGNPP